MFICFEIKFDVKQALLLKIQSNKYVLLAHSKKARAIIFVISLTTTAACNWYETANTTAKCKATLTYGSIRLL